MSPLHALVAAVHRVMVEGMITRVLLPVPVLHKLEVQSTAEE